MKRNLLVCVMALAAVFALTGCNKGNNNTDTTTTQKAEKKLSCSVTENADTVKITLTYDGDSIKKAVFSSTEKKDSEKEAKKQYDKNTEEVKEYNQYKGLSTSTSYSGTLVTSTLTFTVENLDDNSKEVYTEVLGEIKDLNLNDAKTKLESVSYKCTES